MIKSVSPFTASLFFLGILMICPATEAAAQAFKPPLQKISKNPDAEDAKTLPPSFIEASDRLFEIGLPNLRAGEYREVEIKTGSVWGGSVTLKIRGWVLPPVSGEKTRFVVAWNGVVYSVVSIGERESFREDALAVIAKDEKMRVKYETENPGESFSHFSTAISNASSASHATLLPLKAALLFKLGETDLAAKFLAQWNKGVDRRNAAPDEIDDPFLELSSNWAWALFDAALVAHMQGDDEQALSSSRTLAAVEAKIETEAERRGFKKPPIFESNEKPRYLNFLKPFAGLLADQERRAKIQTRRNLSLEEILRNPDKRERIDALIDRMDEIAARQWGQPGGVSLGEDPIVKALVEQGDDAVEPLLRALETDERLTRSVSFTRDFLYQRHIISVGEAAFIALTQILKTTNFGASDENADRGTLKGRRAIGARVRAYLDKYGHQTSEKRWYAMLADDNAAAEQWRQAAANIIAPAGVYKTPPSWVFTEALVPTERKARGIIMQGESLRRRNSPSVAELFRRRMSELAARNTEGFPTDLWQATNFALALLAWEGAESRDNMAAVAAFQVELESRIKEMEAKNPQNAGSMRTWLVNLYLKRCEANDAEAFSEYADWIGKLSPKEAGEDTVMLFKPMWRYAGHQAMAQVAKRLFATGTSEWLPLIDADDRQSFYRAELLQSPLVNVRSFRALALIGLEDKKIVGAIEPIRRGGVEKFVLPVENTFTAVLLSAINASSAEISYSTDDKRAARPVGTVRIRACDAYAAQLARLEDAPRFDISWTEKERDRVISELKKFLTNYGKRFESPFKQF